MPETDALILFVAAALLMNLSPGPSNFYVLSRSLSQGTPAGIIAAAGLAAGSLVHVAAAATGLSAVFVYSPLAYTLLKVAGAAYLVYLGIRYLLAAPGPVHIGRAAIIPARKVFRQSMVVEILNPKTALFFLAFLPQFADPDNGPLAPQILVLGILVTLTAVPCDVLVAVLSGRLADRIKQTPAMLRLRNWLSGSVLIGVGAFVAFSRRAAP
jgi:threonine/homoserine/homoserine lactone efflux protein